MKIYNMIELACPSRNPSGAVAATHIDPKELAGDGRAASLRLLATTEGGGCRPERS